MKLNGSQIVMEVLLEQGVDTVFGYPGGTALNVYDSLYDYQDKIHHIITAHEQGAAHAADGYARATGKTGVVFSTSGPGATNLVTGIATAFLDSVPMVAITCNVAGQAIGRDSFQEVSITGVTLPITKHNFFVNHIVDLAPALRNAFRIANEGRKGPVLVDITKDITDPKCLCEYTKMKPLKLKPVPKISDEVLNEIVEVMKMAKKPVIYYGGGLAASGARKQLQKLVEVYDCPATYTLMAAGTLDYDNPKSLGLIGMHGSMAANRAIDEADLVIALGTRFSDRVALNPKRFAQRAAIIQVDIDESEINKNVVVNYNVIGDVKDVLNRLIPLIPQSDHHEWLDKVTHWKKEVNIELEGAKIRPKELVEAACDLSDTESIYVTDVGQHQLWAAQYIKHYKAENFLTSGGLGTMGYGYGAAIGAAVGCPDKRVVMFTGDGSFHMNLNECCTAVTNNLPIITIIFDNKVLGMVYQWQTVFYKKHYSQTILNRKTDYVKLAEGFGAKGYAVDTIEEFKQAYQEAQKINGPVWIACSIAKEERVLPMIPNGGTIDDMIVD